MLEKEKAAMTKSDESCSKEGPSPRQSNGSEGSDTSFKVSMKSNKRYLLGLSVKKETTVWNLIVMPLLPFITCTINFYAMAFLPLLLESEDHFAIEESELGKATSIVIIWS